MRYNQDLQINSNEQHVIHFQIFDLRMEWIILFAMFSSLECKRFPYVRRQMEYALQIGPTGASKKMVHAYLVLLMRLKVTTYIHEAHMSMRCELPSEPAWKAFYLPQLVTTYKP